jgi:hypothetical protein
MGFLNKAKDKVEAKCEKDRLIDELYKPKEQI